MKFEAQHMQCLRFYPAWIFLQAPIRTSDQSRKLMSEVCFCLLVNTEAGMVVLLTLPIAAYVRLCLCSLPCRSAPAFFSMYLEVMN